MIGDVEFMERLQARTLMLRRAGADPFDTLLSWEVLDHLLAAAIYPLDRLRLMRGPIPVPGDAFVKQRRIDVAALSKLMDQGISLTLNRVDDYVPGIRTLCDALARQTAEETTADAVVTSGKGTASAKRYDSEDIAILQIAGTQRWLVYGPPVISPAKGMPKPAMPEGGLLFDETLAPGDLLLLPAGYWHRSENGPDRSLHVCVRFEPPDGRALLRWLSAQWLADEVFRRPLTRHADAGELAAVEAGLKARLIERIQNVSLAEFLAERRDARSTGESLTLSGRPA